MLVYTTKVKTKTLKIDAEVLPAKELYNVISLIPPVDHTAKRFDYISVTFYRDSMRAQRFQTLITSLFESIWVSNLIGNLSKGRGSLLVNFSFLRHATIKLGSQRIAVKSSDVSWPPLLALSSILTSGSEFNSQNIFLQAVVTGRADFLMFIQVG